MAETGMNIWEPYYDQVTQICLLEFKQKSDIDLWSLFTKLIELDGLPMHCPVHHYILPAALLTTVRKKQGHEIEIIQRDLAEAEKRGRNVLSGFCGFYGSCGAAVGAGIFFSIITDATPHSAGQTWGWANQATGQALVNIAKFGGPRCCKRTSFISLQSVLPQIEDVLEINLRLPQEITCTYHKRNQECLKTNCPFYLKES